jgi:hypothetical protein
MEAQKNLNPFGSRYYQYPFTLFTESNKYVKIAQMKNTGGGPADAADEYSIINGGSTHEEPGRTLIAAISPRSILTSRIRVTQLSFNTSTGDRGGACNPKKAIGFYVQETEEEKSVTNFYLYSPSGTPGVSINFLRYGANPDFEPERINASDVPANAIYFYPHCIAEVTSTP